MPGRSRPLMEHRWIHPRDFEFPPSEFRPPDPVQALLTTKSGVRAYVVSDPLDSVVRISAALPLGRLYERAGEAGAAGLIAQLLAGGGTAHPARPLSLRLESLGTRLQVEEEPDLTCLSLEVLSEDWREGLTLLIDVLRRTQFDRTTIRTYRVGSGYSLPTTTSELDMTGSRFRPRVELERFLGGYPLAPPDPGGQVAPEAIGALFSRSLAANRVVLGVGGNVSRAEVQAALVELTAGWQSSSEALDKTTPGAEEAGPAGSFQTIDEASPEGWIAIGRVLGPLSDSEQAALAVFAEVLSVRLTIAVREIRGLANNVSIQLPGTTRGAGLFVIRSGGRTEGIAPTLKVILEELARIHGGGEPISQDELELAKGILVLGQWQTALDGARQATATFAAETVRHGDTRRLLGWPAAVDVITSREVQAVAENYMDPADMTSLVVGPMEEIRAARHPRWPVAFEEFTSTSSKRGPRASRAAGRATAGPDPPIPAAGKKDKDRDSASPLGSSDEPSADRSSRGPARGVSSGAPPPGGSPGVDVREFSLSNGFRVLVVEDRRIPRVAASLWYRVGGLQEQAGEHGSTHFLEHAIFQGTTSLGTKDFNAERPILEEIHKTEQELLAILNRERNRLRERAVFFDELSWPVTPEAERLRRRLYELEDRDSQYREFWAEYSWYRRFGGLTWHTDPVPASTGSESVEIDIDLPKENVELFFRIEADRMANAVLRGWEAQRFTVLEQSLRALNRPEARFFQALNGATGMAHPTYIAGGAHLRDYAYFNRASMLRIYDDYFVPNNATLVLVGDITSATARSLAERYFGQIPPGAEPPARMDVEVEPTWAGSLRLDWLEALAPRVVVRYRIPGVGHPDRPILDTIAALLRGQHGLLATQASAAGKGPAPAEVRFEAGAARSGSPGTVSLTASARRDEDLEALELAILRVVEDLQRGRVDMKALERARKALRLDWEQTRSERRGRGLGYELGRFQVMDSWRTLESYMKERERASVSEIQRVARQYLAPANRIIGVTRRSPLSSPAGLRAADGQ